jgi:DNA-binding transcriptional ArsR family regulator
MMPWHATLAALTDPARRRLFDRLRRRPHTVGELAKAHGVSQPGISQYLRVLRVARLVVVRPEGTRRYYSAAPDGLREPRTCLEKM